MEYKFVIDGCLPGINEWVSETNRHRLKGNNLKRDSQKTVEAYIRQRLRKVHIEKKVKIHYLFVERTKRRDLDNIAGFAHKVIQDALVECGVLKNDGWEHIVGFTDDFICDNKWPRIEVVIEEVGK